MTVLEKRSATYDLRSFTISEITECGKVLRSLHDGASSMEEVADRIVRYLYDALIDGQTNLQACSLVRFFKTHGHEDLDDDLKNFAVKMLGDTPFSSGMKCLTLLGTVGENQEWNARKTSRGHQTIPLPSEKVVNQIPMMRYLVKQLGLSVSMIVKPDPALLLDMEQKTFNVFFVPEALGSPYIPAQKEFVVPYGIKSVTGFGGMLPSGEVFMVILFLKIPISRETADLFKNLALNIKLAILPFETKVFAPTGKAD